MEGNLLPGFGRGQGLNVTGRGGDIRNGLEGSLQVEGVLSEEFDLIVQGRADWGQPSTGRGAHLQHGVRRRGRGAERLADAAEDGFLIGHGGRGLSRQELAERIWGRDAGRRGFWSKREPGPATCRKSRGEKVARARRVVRSSW